MATLRFNLSTRTISIKEFARSLSQTYEDQAYNGIYYDTIEVKSSGDTKTDQEFINEMKQVYPALLRSIQIVKQF